MITKYCLQPQNNDRDDCIAEYLTLDSQIANACNPARRGGPALKIILF